MIHKAEMGQHKQTCKSINTCQRPNTCNQYYTHTLLHLTSLLFNQYPSHHNIYYTNNTVLVHLYISSLTPQQKQGHFSTTFKHQYASYTNKTSKHLTFWSSIHVPKKNLDGLDVFCFLFICCCCCCFVLFIRNTA